MKTPERATRVAIRDKARIVFVDLTELVSAEAQGNYILLQQQKSGSFLLRETLAKLAEKLGPHGFIRIHRARYRQRIYSAHPNRQGIPRQPYLS